ncbi:rubrerythrin family protein [Geomonas sp. RF6]|uniref:rubrerythrin family protein n=1 Tax=Geomonas sp. RF6 TaxID=2897342 RepID=UPI001E5644F8|nr:rubrerythrin family protein [Geomonas sp. RF6]UFS70167.1 rubrerythrin family protein [Geomonas sp. RF6]
MTKSETNLAAAFAGESQANRKYLAFAKQAEKEGYLQAAKLFRAAAEAETVHAHMHLRVLGGIKSTRENLLEAIGGETHEFTEMYPQMISEASAEGAAQAERGFTWANEVEKVHAGLYQKMLDSLQQGEASYDYYICNVCGHTVEREPLEKCPVCNANKVAFFKAP